MKRNRFSLYGKTVIVTGASGGLGAALTKRLLEHYRCRVIGVARHEEGLKALAASLGDAGDRFDYRVMDVTDREAWKALAADIPEADVLIQNAGMLPRFSRFGGYTPEEAAEGMAVNWQSVLYGCEAFLPLLTQKTGSALLLISSADALCPLAGTSVYSAAKSAVRALAETLREEYRGKLYVPVICPGFIRTGIMRSQRHSVSPLVNAVSMPADRAAGILLRRAEQHRDRIVFGADAHAMSFFYRVAPVWSLRCGCWILKRSGLELFRDLM